MGTKKRVEALDRCKLKLNRIGARGSRAFNLRKGGCMKKGEFEAALDAYMAIAQAQILSEMLELSNVDGVMSVEAVHETVKKVAKDFFMVGFGAGAESCARILRSAALSESDE